jgi:hypothetical protein
LILSCLIAFHNNFFFDSSNSHFHLLFHFILIFMIHFINKNHFLFKVPVQLIKTLKISNLFHLIDNFYYLLNLVYFYLF